MAGVLRRQFLIAAGALVAAPRSVNAQKTKKLYRVGFLTGGDPSQNPELPGAFRQGLRELGCVEGQNIVIGFVGFQMTAMRDA